MHGRSSVEQMPSQDSERAEDAVQEDDRGALARPHAREQRALPGECEFGGW